jgi:hypothetical protein
VLEKITHLAAEQTAELVYDLKLDPHRRLMVQARDRAPVDPGFPRHIRDFQLPFSHQAGEVALDHGVLLRKEMVYRRSKKLAKGQNAAYIDLQRIKLPA